MGVQGGTCKAYAWPPTSCHISLTVASKIPPSVPLKSFLRFCYLRAREERLSAKSLAGTDSCPCLEHSGDGQRPWDPLKEVGSDTVFFPVANKWQTSGKPSGKPGCIPGGGRSRVPLGLIYQIDVFCWKGLSETYIFVCVFVKDAKEDLNFPCVFVEDV